MLEVLPPMLEEVVQHVVDVAGLGMLLQRIYMLLQVSEILRLLLEEMEVLVLVLKLVE